METAELKQCSRLSGKKRRRCNHWFPASDERKMCETCRARRCREAKTEKGRASNRKSAAKYKRTEKGKQTTSRSNKSQAHKDAKKRYNTSEMGRSKSREHDRRRSKTEKRKISFKNFSISEKGRACQKRERSKPVSRVAASLRGMVAGTNIGPVTFRELGVFECNADAQAHFESTFAPWMNWSNIGKRLDETLPNTVWQIGHRIPKAWYRHEDIAEQKKCWSRLNLFAQCAVENHKAGARNILTREQWLVLKPIWPKQCAFMTNEEAWAWARDNVDNRIRREERKARV